MRDVTVGVPAACLLPAARYHFKSVSEVVSIEIPMKGEYPEDFPVEGSFDISPEKGVFLLGEVTKVLFALNKYPNMTESQRFVISALAENESGNLEVVGRIVEFSEV